MHRAGVGHHGGKGGKHKQTGGAVNGTYVVQRGAMPIKRSNMEASQLPGPEGGSREWSGPPANDGDADDE